MVVSLSCCVVRGVRLALGVSEVGGVGTTLMVSLFMVAKYKKGGRLASSYVAISIDTSCPGGRLVLRSFVSMRCIPLRAASSFVARNVIGTANGGVLLITGEVVSNGVFIFSETANGKLQGVGHLKRDNRRCSRVASVILSRSGGRVFIMSCPTEGVLMCSLCKRFGEDLPFPSAYCCRFLSSCSQSRLVNCGDCLPLVRASRSYRMLVSGGSKDIAQGVRVPFGRLRAPIIAGSRTVIAPNFFLVAPRSNGYLLAGASSSAVCGCLPSNALDPFVMQAPSVRSVSPGMFLFPAVVASQCCFVRALSGGFGFRGKENFPAGSLICSGRRGTVFRCAMCGSSFSGGRQITLKRRPRGSMSRRVMAYHTLGTSSLIRTGRGKRLGNGLGRVTTKLGRRSGSIVVLVGHGGWE